MKRYRIKETQPDEKSIAKTPVYDVQIRTWLGGWKTINRFSSVFSPTNARRNAERFLKQLKG